MLSLICLNLPRPKLYTPVSEACLLYWMNPGIRPLAILRQHLLHSCSSEVLARMYAAALAGKKPTAGFVSCRWKCLASSFANRKPHTPCIDLLNHCKGQQRNPDAAWNISAASLSPNCRSSMYFVAV